MKTSKYFTISMILSLSYLMGQSLIIDQELMLPVPSDGIESPSDSSRTNYIEPNSDSLYNDFLSKIIVNSNSRDGDGVYTFTTCGQSGRFGPSQSQATTAYSGTNPTVNVTVFNGIQRWEVPATGTYVIEAYGARGGPGANMAIGEPGDGAYARGTFQLNSGDILHILVGQLGSYTSYSNYYGGGGGNDGSGSDGGALGGSWKHSGAGGAVRCALRLWRGASHHQHLLPVQERLAPAFRWCRC